MEIREEAARSVAAILNEHNDARTSEELTRLLMIAWLDGYKHGGDTVHAMATAAFGRVQAELS